MGVFDVYNRSKLRGVLFWHDFTAAFKPASVETWSKQTLTECKDMLTQKRVFADQDRRSPRADAIIDVLFRHVYVSTKSVPAQLPTTHTLIHGKSYLRAASVALTDKT